MKSAFAFVLALMTSATVSSAANAAWVVSYEGEAPGVQNTTATFTVGGVETFNSDPVHAYPSTLTTSFGTSGPGSTISGVYSSQGKGIQINSADQYGGAGGTGNYIVAFPNTPYSLKLSTDVAGGVNYFGYWLSALDPGNRVTFSDANNHTLFTFDPQDVINAIKTSTTSSSYYGNPTGNFIGQDGGEPFVFVNFFDTTGSFGKVSFSEVNYGGGYESDNHTVGHYLTMGQGTTVPLKLSSSAPEPESWTLMILGVGAVGAVLRRRRQAAMAVTA